MTTTYTEKFLEFVQGNDINLLSKVKPKNAKVVAELNPENSAEAEVFSKLVTKGYSKEQILKESELMYVMKELKPKEFEVYKENEELANAEMIRTSELESFVKVITMFPELKKETEVLGEVVRAMYDERDEMLGTLIELARKLKAGNMLHKLTDITSQVYDKELFEALIKWPISEKTSLNWMCKAISTDNIFSYSWNLKITKGRITKALNVCLQYENPHVALEYMRENVAFRLFQLDKLEMKIKKGYFNPEEDFIEQVYGSKYATLLKREDLYSSNYQFVEAIIEDKKASKLYDAVCAALVNEPPTQTDYSKEALVQRVVMRLKDTVSKVKWNSATEEQINWIIYNADDVSKVMETYDGEEKLEAQYVVSLTKVVVEIYENDQYGKSEHPFFKVEEKQDILKNLVVNSPEFFTEMGTIIKSEVRLKQILDEFDKFEHQLPPALLKEASVLNNDEKYKIKNYYEFELLKQYPGATIDQARKLNIRGDSFKMVKALVRDGIMDELEQGYIEELAEQGFFNIIDSLLTRSQREEYRLLAQAVLLNKFDSLKYPKGDLEKELEIAINDQIESGWKINTSKKSKEYNSTEADDFISLITIGNAPIETCLNATNGSHKHAALSMMDSNKKLLKVFYKGNYALRSVLRLCKIADNAPVQRPLEFVDVENMGVQEIVDEASNERVALFLEVPYTYLDAEQKKEAMKQLIELAKDKAKSMNCELVLSTPYGELVKQKVERICVHISKSKNGVQYVDSLQGQYDDNAFGYYAEGNFVVLKP